MTTNGDGNNLRQNPEYEPVVVYAPPIQMEKLPTTAIGFNWDLFVIGLVMSVLGWYNVYKK